MRKLVVFFLLLLFHLFTFSQEFEWARGFGGINGDNANSISTDSSGNVFITGGFSSTVDFDPSSGVYNLTSNGGSDVFIAKYSANGNFIWAKQIGGTTYDISNSINIDVDGNVIIAGVFSDTVDFDPGVGFFNLNSVTNRTNAFVCKLDNSGSFIWAKSIKGIYKSIGTSVYSDLNGNIALTGYFERTTDFDPGVGVVNKTSNGNFDIFVLRLKKNGDFSWVRTFGNALDDISLSVTTDKDGNIYSTGYFAGTVDFNPGIPVNNLASSGAGDVFILKLDSNGNYSWAQNVGGVSTDIGNSIKVDENKNVYVAGEFRSTADFDPGVSTYNFTAPPGNKDGFVLKLNSLGNFVWAKQFSGVFNVICLSIDIDKLENVYTTGWYRGTVDFDPDVTVNNLTANGFSDIFISKLNSSGSYSWALSLGSTFGNVGHEIHIDNSNSVYTTGVFGDTVDFNHELGVLDIISKGSGDIFIHKIGRATTNYDTVCNSFVSPGGNIWTTSGTYYDSLKNSSGQDSIIQYELVVNNFTSDTLYFSQCDSVTTQSGKVFKISGIYYDTLTNSKGCDSIVVYDVIINYSSIAEIQKLVASDRGTIDQFGKSVAISGNYAVIGANGEDQDANGLNTLSDPGSAYVFERNPSGIWVEKQKLVASDRGANDGFGSSVAISGNYLLVSAYSEDEDILGLNTLSDAGSAYVFERNSSGVWIEKQKLVASDRGINDRFGYSVSIAGDYIAIGADQEDEDSSGTNTFSDAGSVYVFERNSSGVWVEKQKLVNSDRAANDLFGTSVSIFGRTLVIGAHNESENVTGTGTLAGAGSIYVFERNISGIWTENQKMVASDRAPGSSFGISVSISNNYIVSGAYGEIKDATGANSLTGAGAAYVFERNSSGIWNESQKLVPSDRNYSDFFGFSVSISGKNALIGAWLEDEDTAGTNSLSAAGSAYVFERNSSGVWIEKQKLIASDRASDDRLGMSVSISGNSLLLGSHYEDEDTLGLNTLNLAGSAYLYELIYSSSSFDSIKDTVCENYTSAGGKIWTNSGIYYDTIFNSAGCDSIIKYNLIIHNSFDTTLSYSDCDSVLLPNGIVAKTSGLYYDSLQTANGCDSIYIYSVTINNSIGANLNLDWAKLMGGSGNNEQADAVTTDIFGNVFTTGYFHGTVDFDPGVGVFNLTANGANYDIFISKLDPNGNFLWAKKLDGVGEDKAFSVTTDKSGAVYITGYFQDTLDFNPGVAVNDVAAVSTNDAFILKLDATGNFVWVKHYGASNGQIGFSVTTDDFDNLYATGSFYSVVDFDAGSGTFNMSPVGLFDIYFLKLNSAGNLVWAKQIGGSNYEQAWNIHTNNSSVYLTGNFQGTTDFDPGAGTANLTAAGSVDAFVARYDANGNYIWARKFEGTGVEQGKWVTTDNAGNVYSTGEIMATTDFDPSAAAANLTSNGNADTYLSKLDSNGNYVWAKSFGGTLGDFSASVHADNTGDVYLMNIFRGTVDYDPNGGVSNLTSNGQYDIAIGKYSSAGNLIWAEGIGGTASEVVNSGHLDQSGTIYLAGYSTGTSDYDPSRDSLVLATSGLRDILVAKYNQITIINDTVCDQYVSASGKIFTSSGIYYDSINNSAGCDSIIEYDLVINYSFRDSITDTVCDSTIWRGMSLTSSGVYRDTVPASCDSVFILNLHVDSTTRITIDTILCPGDTLTLLSGIKVFASGTYNDTIVTNAGNRVVNNVLFYENFEGGSHQFTLNTNDLLSITPGTNDNAWIVNDSYQGGSFLMLGVFPVTVPNTPNQNTLVTGDTNSKYLHIYSKLAAASSASITNCNYIDSSLGDLSIGQNGMNFSKMTSDISTIGRTNVSFNFYYLCGGSWGRIYYSINGGVSWVPAGTFNSSTWTSFTSSNSVYDNQATLRFGVAFDNRDGITTDPAYGVDEISIRSIDTVPNLSCDSIIIYNVIAPPINDTVLYDTICANDSYVLPNGLTHNGSGTYRDTIIASTGCDSIRILNLIVNDTSSSIQTLIACDSFVSPSGKIWKTSGIYYDTIANSVGCDSLMTFNISVNKNFRDTLDIILCDSIISPSGKIWKSPGIYFDTLPTSNGCDSIFVYCISSINFSFDEINKIVASDRGVSDGFGRTVSISGNYAIVGASDEDEDELSTNTLVQSGSCYIFEKDTNGVWIEVQKLVASDRMANANFGYSVSISGNFAIVGAYSEQKDPNGNNLLFGAGACYIFERNTSGVWNEVQKIVASDRAVADAFGISVSISDNFAIVGAVGEDEDENGLNTIISSGSSYIFERDVFGVWNEVKKIVAPVRGANDDFGRAVTISGNYAVVGSPKESEDALELNTLNSSGSSYIFERNLIGDWNLAQKLVASDRGILSDFGNAVSISGSNLIVAANRESEDASGSNTLNDAGSVYIFERSTSGIWTEKQKIVASDREQNVFFGQSVSISGKTALVGAWREPKDDNSVNSILWAGAGYIYEKDGTGVWTEKQKIVASDRSSEDEFGVSVSISGNHIIVGAFFEDEDEFGGNTLLYAGSSYIFELSRISDTIKDSVCGNYISPLGNTWTSSGIYSDTFTSVNGCDSIIVYDLIINYSSNSLITLILCDSLISPSGKIWRTSGIYNDTIPNSVGCDSLMTFNLTVSSEYRDTLIVSGCDTSVTWRGTQYSTTIIISDTITTGPCDSIFTLDLTVIPSITLTRNDTACDSIQLPSGTFVNSSGTYRDTFVRSNGCDSIIVSEIIVNQPTTFLLTQVVCDSFVSPSGKIWKFDGVYYDTISNSVGCDSLMTFNITISSIYRDTLVIIHCDSPTGFRGWVYFTDTIVNDTVTSGFCDSIFTLDFTNYPVYNIQVYDTACDSVLLPTGNWVDSSGFYLDSNTSVNGCDSIYIYNIIINNPIYATQSIIVCDSMISPSGKIWRTSGTYFDTISTSKGCDSLITFNLTISSEYRDTLIVSGCDTSITWRGTLYSNTIIISDTSTSGSCDSIFTLNLTVIPSITLTRNDTACDSIQLPNGTFVKSSGIYRDTFARSNGCDSIIVSEVIVNQPTSSSQTLSACDSLISPSGKIWRTSGIYNDTIANSAGCDSLITFNLTIGGETSSTISPSACKSYISPSGKMYSFSGTYSDTIPNSVGCDSIIAINLTLISDTTITMLANDCDSYTLPGGGVVTLSGTYRDTLIGSNGCDSIIITNLVLGQSYANSQTLSICNGETISVGGSVYGATGVYQDTFLTALGCDSIITTNLTVNPSTPANITFTTNMCENANPITFTSTPAGGTWSGGGIDAATGLFDPSVSGAGSFRIYYKAPGSCGETDSVDITVFSTPTIIATVVDDQCDAGQGAIGIVLGGGTGTINYSWSTGDTTSSLQDLKEGTYSLRVVDANGCSDRATFEVVNLSSDTCEYHVYLPNIFSPDGNGQNDVFRVEGDGIEKLEFKIFNRWGNLIFESTDQTNGWDGTYKGQQVNQGVFVYQVVGNFVDGKKFSKKGTVTLVRR